LIVMVWSTNENLFPQWIVLGIGTLSKTSILPYYRITCVSTFVPSLLFSNSVTYQY
jgi:hypothetical protein